MDEPNALHFFGENMKKGADSCLRRMKKLEKEQTIQYYCDEILHIVRVQQNIETAASFPESLEEYLDMKYAEHHKDSLIMVRKSSVSVIGAFSGSTFRVAEVASKRYNGPVITTVATTDYAERQYFYFEYAKEGEVLSKGAAEARGRREITNAAALQQIGASAELIDDMVAHWGTREPFESAAAFEKCCNCIIFRPDDERLQRDFIIKRRLMFGEYCVEKP